MSGPVPTERERHLLVRSLRQQARDLERFALRRLEAGRPREVMLSLAARRAAHADALESGRVVMAPLAMAPPVVSSPVAAWA